MTPRRAKQAKKVARDISLDKQVRDQLSRSARRVLKRFLDRLDPEASRRSVCEALDAAQAEAERQDMRYHDILRLRRAMTHIVSERGGSLPQGYVRRLLQTAQPNRRKGQAKDPSGKPPTAADPPVVWTPTKLAAYDFAVPEFYVDPIITPDGIVLIIGPREAGKTQFVFTLVRELSEEGLLLGRFQCRQTPVVLVEVDMPDISTQARIQHAMRAYKFDDELFRIVTPGPLNILEVSHRTHWVREVNDFGPGIIIFDSLRKIHRESEIDTRIPSLVYGTLKELFPKATVGATHHVRKLPPPNTQAAQGLRPAEDLDAYRGTTAWLDDADTGLMLAYDRRKKRRTFRVDRARHADDSVKDEITPIRFNDESLFLEPADPTPQMRLMEWWHQNPDAKLNDAVQWLHDKYPKKSRQTYYNWCHNVGIESD